MSSIVRTTTYCSLGSVRLSTCFFFGGIWSPPFLISAKLRPSSLFSGGIWSSPFLFWGGSFSSPIVLGGIWLQLYSTVVGLLYASTSCVGVCSSILLGGGIFSSSC